jgi:HTH-type transcriptional regulator/antitoxin HigA
MNNSSAYIELLTTFPPRPINAEEELMATQEAIDSLLDKGELTRDERDYLHVLGMLVYEYEQTLELIPDIYGVELLKALIENFELRQKDLVPIFKTESIVTNSIENFPCDDLRTIDQLWVKYSQGRFGFSVQKKIWLEVGGKVDYDTECKLGDRVGWRKGGKVGELRLR